MVNLETYYSFANIRKGNNSFKWSTDEGKTWTLLHIPTGCYELKAINAEITRIRGNSDITILPNVNTLQCILTVVGAKCKVSFDVPNSLASVLDFKQDIVNGVGRHASEKLVNIMSVNSILVHCNIIHSSYIRGQQAPVVYNYLPKCCSWTENFGSATQFNLPPSDCRRHFDFVSVADGEHLDLRGEKLTIRFHLRER